MDRSAFRELINPYDKGITVDIGTGDGLFVYHSARREPHKFFIGIDASHRPLQKISEKIHRSLLKGGLPNVLFVRAAVEALPFELDGVAGEVRINFPWGSLLRGVATGDQVVLANLRRICTANALLKIIIGLDFDRDRSEIVRLGLSQFETGYINSVLAAAYRNAGFDLAGTKTIVPSDWPEFQTSWAKRLRTSRNRSFIRIVARVVKN